MAALSERGCAGDHANADGGFLVCRHSIGGFDLGFERAGYDIRWQVEIDPWCRRVLEKHWPHVPQYDDVRLIREGDVAGTFKKLTQEQADQSVLMYDRGLSLAHVARYFGVSRQSMWDLLRRRTTMRTQLRHGRHNHFYRGGETQDDRAQNLAEKAIRRGILKRPDTCQQCGQQPAPFADGRSGIQAHHDDYNRPLEVRWLCQLCHHAWHQVHTPIARKEVPVEPIDVLVGGFP